MTTANDIVTQLEELWENAEPGPTREGDALIYRFGEGDFKIEPSADLSRDSRDHIRTLERAKPKPPEWEAVVASYLHGDDHKREVYFRTRHGGWESETRLAGAGDLVDPVPLVELPDRDALADAIARGETRRRMGHGGPSPRGYHEADAVLELLKRR